VAEDPAELLRARYDAAYIEAKVPTSAMTVCLNCNITTSRGASLRHYCWLRDGELMLFPEWEGLSQCDVEPRGWRIPVSNIICFATEQGLPNKFTVLQYSAENDVLHLAFSEDAAKVFEALLPEKDFTSLLEELYPKSSRNIRDIRENFVSLKQLREEDLITEGEYIAKKKEMLILM
jgi:hypothetical protein